MTAYSLDHQQVVFYSNSQGLLRFELEPLHQETSSESELALGLNPTAGVASSRKWRHVEVAFEVLVPLSQILLAD